MTELLDERSVEVSEPLAPQASKEVELEAAMRARRERQRAHKSTEFNFGQEGYKPGTAGEIRMIGRELKDGLRVIRAKRALRKMQD